jgi:hypothetical protein
MSRALHRLLERKNLATRSAVAEETNQSSRPRLLGTNAFRTLSLSADTELKKIYRQQQRLQVAMDLEEAAPAEFCGIPALSAPAKADVLDAVHRLERPNDRLLEELFWLHQVDELTDLSRSQVIATLSGSAVSNTSQGIVARHNLAILHSILGLEVEPEQWKPALDLWADLLNADLFWAFLKMRAQKVECPKPDPVFLKTIACRRLGATVSAHIAREVKRGDAAAVAVLVRISREHRSWLDLASALQLVEQQHIRNGYVLLGALHDRVACLSSAADASAAHGSLAEIDRELSAIATHYGAVVHNLCEHVAVRAWDNAIASLYQEIALVYLHLLADPGVSARLLVQARELASEPRLRESIERDQRAAQKEKVKRECSGRVREAADRAASIRQRQNLERAALCREAEELASFGDFDSAEQKIMAARALSSEQQNAELDAVLTRFAWARVLWGIDTSRKNPRLATVHGAGAALLGRRKYDPATGSYVAFHWITVFSLPVFPLGAYRVSGDDPESRSVYGKTPFPISLGIARAFIVAGAIACASLGGLWGNSYGLPLHNRAPRPIQKSTTSAPHPATAAREVPDLQHSPISVSQPEDLAPLRESLNERARKLNEQTADLQKRKLSLDTVAASYNGRNVPGDGWATYQAVLAQYNSSLEKHNAALLAYQADWKDFQKRLDSNSVEGNSKAKELTP